MIVLVVPIDHTLTFWDPPPIEAKKFADREAVFWLQLPRGRTPSGALPFRGRLATTTAVWTHESNA